MKEIERKYVARLETRALPPMDDWTKYMLIEQAYVFVSDAVEWRIRDTTHFIGPKLGRRQHTALKFGNGYVRLEYEVRIPRLVYRLLRLFTAVQLRKSRINLGGWEIDQFFNDLAGLVLAEYEVRSEADPRPPLPSGLTLVADVTESGQFSNKRLSRLTPWNARRLVHRAYGDIETAA